MEYLFINQPENVYPCCSFFEEWFRTVPKALQEFPSSIDLGRLSDPRLRSDRSLCSQAQRPWEQPRNAPEVTSGGWRLVISRGFEQHLGPSLVFPKLFPQPLRNISSPKKMSGTMSNSELSYPSTIIKLGPLALTLSFLMSCSKLGMRRPIFLRCSCPKRPLGVEQPWQCHPDLRRILKCTT